MGYKIGQSVYFIDEDDFIRKGIVTYNYAKRSWDNDFDYITIKSYGIVYRGDVSTNKNRLFKKVKEVLESRKQERLEKIVAIAEEVKTINRQILENEQKQKKNKVRQKA